MSTVVSIQGLRGTGNFGADERPKDFREMILFLNPNGSAPLTALMSKMRSEGLTDPEFSWWEEEMEQVRLKLGAAVADGVATTFTIQAGSVVDSTGGFSVVPGDVLMFETSSGVITGEIVQVASVASDTSITVVRGVAGTTPAAMANNGFLLKIGNAFAEGTRSPTASTRNPVKLSNFAQIFKTAYELTKTVEKTKFRTGDPKQIDKKRKMFDHSNALEYAYLFGRKFETVGSNGKPMRFTGGLFQFLSAQTSTFAGAGLTWTEDNFIDSISPCFNFTADGVGNERIVLAGNGALTELNKLARNSSSTRVNFDGTVKTYGMELQRWVLPQGTIYIRTHPLFNNHPTYRYAMLGLNPSGLRDRKLRDHTFMDNIQENDADTAKGQWIGETGLEVNHAKTNFILLNCGNKLP
jgi:hypothetical protein